VSAYPTCVLFCRSRLLALFYLSRYEICSIFFFFFFSSRRRHTRSKRDWSSDVCSSDLKDWLNVIILSFPVAFRASLIAASLASAPLFAKNTASPALFSANKFATSSWIGTSYKLDTCQYAFNC